MRVPFCWGQTTREVEASESIYRETALALERACGDTPGVCGDFLTWRASTLERWISL